MPVFWRREILMKMILTEKQIRAYQLVSGEFEGLSTDEAAKRMKITPQAVNRLLKRAEKLCPQLFPLFTKQEAKVKIMLTKGRSNTDIANQLGVSLSRVSQIIGSVCGKRNYDHTLPVKILRYEPHMDSQIRRKF